LSKFPARPRMSSVFASLYRPPVPTKKSGREQLDINVNPTPNNSPPTNALRLVPQTTAPFFLENNNMFSINRLYTNPPPSRQRYNFVKQVSGWNKRYPMTPMLSIMVVLECDKRFAAASAR